MLRSASNTILIALSVTTAFFVGASSAAPQDTSKEVTYLDAFNSFIVGGVATRLQIEYVPYALTTVVAIQPWTLGRSAWVKCDVEIKGDLKREFEQQLASAKTKEIDAPNEIRWGLTLYSQAGEEIDSIYLSRSFSNSEYAVAWGNGQWFDVDRRLVQWLEGRFNEDHFPRPKCWVRGLFLDLHDR